MVQVLEIINDRVRQIANFDDIGSAENFAKGLCVKNEIIFAGTYSYDGNGHSVQIIDEISRQRLTSRDHHASVIVP